MAVSTSAMKSAKICVLKNENKIPDNIVLTYIPVDHLVFTDEKYTMQDSSSHVILDPVK